MPFVRVATGDRLHYLDVGRGRPCVLLHGFGMQAAHFLPFVLPLAANHRFILVDQRGFGGSSRLRLRGPDLLLSHAQDLDDVLRELRLDRPALGGISMGAATSLAYLRHFGFGHVSAYVHIDQSPRVRNDATYRDGVFGEAQGPIFAAWTALGDELEACGRDTPYASIPQRLRRAFARKLAEFFSYAFHGRMLRASSVLVRYERFARQFLEPESMYPPAGQLAMREHVRHARVVRFERVGHAVPAEAPVRFSRALGAFLREARA